MRLFPLVDGAWNRFDRGGTMTRPFDINLMRQRGGSSVSRRVGKTSRVHRRENDQDEFDLDSHVIDQVDNRLTTSDTALFSPAYANGQTNTWNSNCWAADLDFTGLSPWNSQDPNFGGTLISRRHVLFAWHSSYTPIVDTEIVFVRADGSECIRTIIGRERVGTEDDRTDLGVCYLNEDVPSGVTFYKCTIGHWTGFMELSRYRNLPYTRGAPVVICDQEEKALAGEVETLVFFTYTYPEYAFRISQGDSPLDAYWEEIVDGDSGHPSFLIIGNELVLLGIHSKQETGSLFDADVGAYYVLINTAMSDLDVDNTGYQVTLIDLRYTGDLLGSEVKRRVGKTSDQIRRTP